MQYCDIPVVEMVLRSLIYRYFFNGDGRRVRSVLSNALRRHSVRTVTRRLTCIMPMTERATVLWRQHNRGIRVTHQ